MLFCSLCVYIVFISVFAKAIIIYSMLLDITKLLWFCCTVIHLGIVFNILV